MDLNDVYVSGAYGRQLLRLVRRQHNLRMAENTERPRHLSRKNCDAGVPDLSLFGLDSSWRGPSGGALGLWVADQASRCQATGVQNHVVQKSLPRDAFVAIDLLNSDGSAVPGSTIHCESPSFSILTYARELSIRIKQGQLTELQAIPRLTMYAMELMGTYAQDPYEPGLGEDAFDVDVAVTRKGLEEFLGKMRGYSGVRLARKAVAFALEDAASRMETALALLTSLPPRFGGVPIGRADLNQALKLTEQELSLIKHRSIRPDLLWSAYRLIVEYDGIDHHSAPKQKREDKYRIQDYQTLGYTVFPVTFEDVRTVTALDKLLLRLVEVVSRTRGDQYLRTMKHFLREPKQRVRRMRLLAMVLPPVRDR